MSVELSTQAVPDPLRNLTSGSHSIWVELGLTRAREGFCSSLRITVLTFKRWSLGTRTISANGTATWSLADEVHLVPVRKGSG